MIPVADTTAGRGPALAQAYETRWLERLASRQDRHDWLDMAQFGKALEAVRASAHRRLWHSLGRDGLIEPSTTPARADGHPLDALARACDGPVPSEIYIRLSDHCLNAALEEVHRVAWRAELVRDARSVLDCAVRHATAFTDLLFLERWASAGHPAHPFAKARSGLLPDEVMAYAADFRSEVALPVMALHRDTAQVEAMPGADSYTDWFAAEFPGAFERWRTEVRNRAGSASGYVPLPVHPWQLQHRVRDQFCAELAARKLLITGSTVSRYAPMASLRTLSPVASAHQPDIKLPVDILLTSVNRTISARTCIMGPQLSGMFEAILATEPEVFASLAVQGEHYSVHFADASGRGREKQLNVVYRRAVNGQRRPGDCIIPCHALLQQDLEPERTLLYELIQRSEGSLGPGAALRYFRRYVNALLPGLLRLYLVHGIAFEAHEQNTLLVSDRNGSIRRFILRDLGGIRVHLPTIRRRGFDLRLPADRLTVVDHREPLRHKFTHSVLHSHLGGIVRTAIRGTGVEASALWRCVFDIVQPALMATRAIMEADAWRQEYAALLESPWQTKAFTRMVLLPERQDIYQPCDNPLSRFVSGHKLPESAAMASVAEGGTSHGRVTYEPQVL